MSNVVPFRYGSNSPIPPREDRDWLTLHELIEEAGVSYRQADYWTRTGLLATVPVDHQRSGRLRGYPVAQLERVIAIKQLLDAGVSLTVIRAHIDEFTATGHLELGPITIARTSGDPA